VGQSHHLIYVCLSVELAIPVCISALCNQCKQRLEGTDTNFKLRVKPWPGAKCDVIALRKLTYVICALLLPGDLCVPGHVGMVWNLLQKQCTFGNRGLSSHSEGDGGREGFWNS